MIVCNICGTALPGLQIRCSACSGQGIEKPSPVRSLLTPTQRRGSPDRWAQSYTTPPGRSPSSPLAREHTSVQTPLPSTPRHGTYLDVQATPTTDLARVYGTLLDKAAEHPRCANCTKVLSSDSSIYLPKGTSEGEARSPDALCRSCFGLRFSKGSCEHCRLPVIGDEKGPHKGAHVRGRGETVWHSHCFNCNVCGLGLYKHDHLLSVQGHPYCPSCYDSILQPARASTRRSNHTISTPGMPAGPSTSRRRFAPPGLVVVRTQPPDASSTQPQKPLDTLPAASALVAAVPLQICLPLNDNGGDCDIPHLLRPKDIDPTNPSKTTQGLYRGTVKDLARRFELPDKVGPGQMDPEGRIS